MNHYKKVSSRYIEDAPVYNEVRITTTGKTSELIKQAVEILRVRADVAHNLLYIIDASASTVHVVLLCIFPAYRIILKEVCLYQHVEVM